MSEFYNRKGEPISHEVFSELHSVWEYKSVKRTVTNNKVISTVWLGMNYAWGEGKPIIFETMVFELEGDDGIGEELWCERYSTLDEAKENHDRIVAEVVAETFMGYGV